MYDHAIHYDGRCGHHAITHDALEILDFFERGIDVLLGKDGLDELVGGLAAGAAATENLDLGLIGHFDSSLYMKVEGN
jgi:hypothetical protein